MNILNMSYLQESFNQESKNVILEHCLNLITKDQKEHFKKVLKLIPTIGEYTYYVILIDNKRIKILGKSSWKTKKLAKDALKKYLTKNHSLSIIFISELEKEGFIKYKQL